MLIAIPLVYKKNIESKVNELVFKTKSAAVKLNWLLNQGLNSPSKVFGKYIKAFTSYISGMLEYKLVPSIFITVLVPASFGHLFKESTLSRI